ncbi:prolipoprotein diacylglyceryl transferase [Nocardioides albidus]|uniref:Phosphatidylglycerol--prolipoprotein diacylglyceryl transferase n=1 Tax=Nocardioides albidus TaxID=1517589 RepID=A0A5C4WAY5_9ACTN|nr:prolipoprotein diacylglyceryl transferase [Nocardioides albidus]TNM45173.1 prolipoprotein diacylglyceryl transferase [Nocardioides albidus]
MLPELIAATIPSPSQGVWHLGPFPLRGYALCIILGIVVAIWIGERRWQARGGTLGEIQDVAIWAVPFGLVGARLYHVATDWEKYFGDGGKPVEALYVWHGGLGIWGGVGLGAVGALIGARRRGIRVLPLLDTLAPGVLVAQAIGRWGNWFNQELYGRPTDLPWGLEIDRAHFSGAYLAQNPDVPSVDQCASTPDLAGCVATFHPTYLYECLWNLAAFALIIWLERRFRLGHGRVLAVYVMAYTLGRGWIEDLRIDDVQLDDVLGLRFNVWTSIVLFVLAAAYFVWASRNRPGREESVYVDGRVPDSPDSPDDVTVDASTDENG